MYLTIIIQIRYRISQETTNSYMFRLAYDSSLYYFKARYDFLQAYARYIR